MAPAQYAMDGKLGKDWKITSLMGWRVHPVQKIKKHHNGTDIISTHSKCWIEAPYDAKVLEAKKSTSPGGGFGNYVILLHKINGKHYTSLYAHMADGSLKVKKGQKITAGTVLGLMGSTGMSTGRHLHWELRLGKAHTWDAKGKNYIEPVAFFKALIAQEKAIASAKVVATEADPVAEAPTHDEAQADALEAQRQAQKAQASEPATPAPAPAPTKPAPTKSVAKTPAKPAVSKPAPKKVKLYTVKAGDTYWGIGQKSGIDYRKIQKLNGNKALKPGDKIQIP